MGCGSRAKRIQIFLSLRFRQRLLPIEDEFPLAGRVGLPDLEKMAGRGGLRSRVGTRAVAVGQVRAAAHIGFHDFHRDAGLPGPEQFDAVLFADRRKRPVAIKPHRITSELAKRFREIELCRSDERFLRFFQRLRRSFRGTLWRHELQRRFHVRTDVLNPTIERDFPGTVFLFFPD